MKMKGRVYEDEEREPREVGLASAWKSQVKRTSRFETWQMTYSCTLKPAVFFFHVILQVLRDLLLSPSSHEHPRVFSVHSFFFMEDTNPVFGPECNTNREGENIFNASRRDVMLFILSI